MFQVTIFFWDELLILLLPRDPWDCCQYGDSLGRLLEETVHAVSSVISGQTSGQKCCRNSKQQLTVVKCLDYLEITALHSFIMSFNYAYFHLPSLRWQRRQGRGWGRRDNSSQALRILLHSRLENIILHCNVWPFQLAGVKNMRE